MRRLLSTPLTIEQKKNLIRLIKALESGKYKKARKKLQRRTANGNSTFCCLGVACDLVKDSEYNWKEQTWSGIKPIIEFGTATLDVYHEGLPPGAIAMKFGFMDRGLNIAALNDQTAGYTQVIKRLKSELLDQGVDVDATSG